MFNCVTVCFDLGWLCFHALYRGIRREAKIISNVPIKDACLRVVDYHRQGRHSHVTRSDKILPFSCSTPGEYSCMYPDSAILTPSKASRRSLHQPGGAAKIPEIPGNGLRHCAAMHQPANITPEQMIGELHLHKLIRIAPSVNLKKELGPLQI